MDATAAGGGAGTGRPGWPSGSVTFLFTDLEGSTGLWEHQPASMAAALARHDALLGEAIAAHGGVVFKTVGDAYHAAFAGAAAALAAALAAQRRLLAEPWPETGPLRVRMALHLCEAAPLPEGDYRTPGLNRLGRLMGVGAGGQVILSTAVAEAARGALPPGVELRDLGEHRLRDLLRGEPIYQLVAPDLPDDFPPLKTLERHRHNLPAQPTALVGREQEVATARALLAEGRTRLLTLTGSGGTGKTRLGLQVAAEAVDAFADGVVFVPLAAVVDPTMVAAAIAPALGVRETGDVALVSAIAKSLGERHVLLVLDNFEQIATAASLVAELLASCPHVQVLVTSRTRLRLRGERELAVPPLALPGPKQRPDLATLARYPAIRLFVERVQDVRPAFALTDDNASAVTAVCQRLDGLPLAIELAAARVKLLSPQAMLPRLERRLTLLTGGARDLPLRQQTLRAAIAWSHDLLSPGERALFRRLAVCVGGFTLAAAEEIAAGAGQDDDDLDVLDTLGLLVDHSLVRREEAADGDDRYRMLETIREYGLDRLAESPDAEATRDRHAAHFLSLAEQVEPQLTGPLQGAGLDRLEAEHDNARAALACALERGEPETALRLGAALWRFWQVRGHLSEGRVWLGRALASGAGLATVARVRALNGAGVLASLQEDHQAAIALHRESLELARALDDRLGIARAQGDLGYVALGQGDLARAAALFEEALTLRRVLGDPEGTALQVINLGEIARHQGDLAGAAARYEEALGLFQGLGNTFRVEIALGNLAAVARAGGDLTTAGARYREALALQAQIGDQEGAAYSLSGLAGVAADQGWAEDAARLLGAAAALCDEVGVALQPLERTQFERDREVVHAALGEAAFNAAWSGGQVDSFAAAVAHAGGEQGHPNADRSASVGPMTHWGSSVGAPADRD